MKEIKQLDDDLVKLFPFLSGLTQDERQAAILRMAIAYGIALESAEKDLIDSYPILRLS